jgi:hypothetical protein
MSWIGSSPLDYRALDFSAESCEDYPHGCDEYGDPCVIIKTFPEGEGGSDVWAVADQWGDCCLMMGQTMVVGSNGEVTWEGEHWTTKEEAIAAYGRSAAHYVVEGVEADCHYLEWSDWSEWSEWEEEVINNATLLVRFRSRKREQIGPYCGGAACEGEATLVGEADGRVFEIEEEKETKQPEVNPSTSGTSSPPSVCTDENATLNDETGECDCNIGYTLNEETQVCDPNLIGKLIENKWLIGIGVIGLFAATQMSKGSGTTITLS